MGSEVADFAADDERIDTIDTAACHVPKVDTLSIAWGLLRAVRVRTRTRSQILVAVMVEVIVSIIRNFLAAKHC